MKISCRPAGTDQGGQGSYTLYERFSKPDDAILAGLVALQQVLSGLNFCRKTRTVEDRQSLCSGNGRAAPGKFAAEQKRADLIGRLSWARWLSRLLSYASCWRWPMPSAQWAG
jgi:hypothetical protein